MSDSRMSRMPPQHLWTGLAREAYLRMAASVSYGSMRVNPVAELVCGLEPASVLLLGAGPEPQTEVSVLNALSAMPLRIAVHDIDVNDACQAKERIANILDPLYRLSKFFIVGGDIRQPSKVVSSFGEFDLTTFLGYSFGNLPDEEAMEMLLDLTTVSRHFLLDVPVAWHGDPRLKADTFDPTAEAAWLNAAYVSWRGYLPLEGIQSEVQQMSDGYVVRIVADNAELLRFRRRSVSGWMGLFERGGWALRRASVSDGHPRLAALLSSV